MDSSGITRLRTHADGTQYGTARSLGRGERRTTRAPGRQTTFSLPLHSGHVLGPQNHTAGADRRALRTCGAQS